ncbi:MAG: copper resistance protein B [Lysobacteraceae bacterium]
MSASRDDTSRSSLWLALAVGCALAAPALAQDSMQGMDMTSMPGMEMPATKTQSPPAAHEKHPKAKHHPKTPQHHAISTIAPPVPPATTDHMKGMQSASMPNMDMHDMHTQSSPVGTPARSTPTESMTMQTLQDGQMPGERSAMSAPVGQGSAMTSMHGKDMDAMMRAMQGGTAPPEARSAGYSDGQLMSAMPGMDMADNAPYGMLRLNQFEYAHGRDGNALFVDGDAYYGTDLNKVWLKAEGERSGGRLQDLRTEVLWDHAFSTYFSSQLGVRHDFGEGPGRSWAVFGVQGLAPYWLETEAALYVGEQGRTAAWLQVEYDARITQQLILQPKLELNLYGRDDPQRGIGSGLSDAELGLRLRYEIRREIAPYIGVVYRQRYGNTADAARLLGESSSDLQWVVGLHFWF